MAAPKPNADSCSAGVYADLRSSCHPDSIVWHLVVHLLRLRWSHEQIVLTLERLHPSGHEQRVSHEIICNCIYAMSVGELCKELIATMCQDPQQAVAAQRRQRPQGAYA